MANPFNPQLPSGHRLSARYQNTEDNFKIVSDYILGYAVEDYAVTVIYRATVRIKVGDTWHNFDSHEHGERLSGVRLDDDAKDLGFIARTAIRALLRKADRDER